MTTYTIEPQELNISVDFEQAGEVSIVRSQIWWNNAYSARRNLKITAPPDGLPKNHPITVFVPKSIYTQGKVQSDLKDLEVLYLVDTVPDVWRRLPRSVESVSNYYRIRFLVQDDLGGGSSTESYYVYYANPFRNAVYPLGNPYIYSISELDWPLEALYSDSSVSYTRPGEHWKSGESDTPEAKASFQFYGPQVKIIMDKGPSFGIVEVQVDSSGWEEIDLYNPTLLQSQEIFLKGQLGDGIHNVRIKVTGRKNPASSSANVKLKSFKYKKHSIAQDLKEDQYSNYNWSGRIAGV